MCFPTVGLPPITQILINQHHTSDIRLKPSLILPLTFSIFIPFRSRFPRFKIALRECRIYYVLNLAMYMEGGKGGEGSKTLILNFFKTPFLETSGTIQ